MSENEKLVIEAILASVGLEPLKIHDPETREILKNRAE
jgi:hypothetical protein